MSILLTLPVLPLAPKREHLEARSPTVVRERRPGIAHCLRCYPAVSPAETPASVVATETGAYRRVASERSVVGLG